MSPKRSYADTVRGRLLGFWDREDGYGDPIGCACTTYTFDAPFFEEECLSCFVGMQSDPREDGRVYIVEREERFSQIFACVLVDRSQVARERSLRWNLLPVSVPRQAILHAKVSLLAWEKRIRVLIGSANLTEAAYRFNFENMAVLDFTPEGETPLEVLRDVLAFLRQLRQFTPGGGGGGEAGDGPIGSFNRFLDRVQVQIRVWADVGWRRGEPSVALIPILPGRPSLFEQIATDFWRGTLPADAKIVSPFFDPGSKCLESIDALATCMAASGVRTVGFHVPGQVLPDGTVELHAPEALRKPERKRWVHEFHLVDRRDENEDSRNLHAKYYWFQRESQALCMIGSSNFTAAGTGSAKDGRINIEANLAYLIPPDAQRFANQCKKSAPPSEFVDLEESVVTFDTKEDRTPEATKYAPLPSGFGLALFRPEEETGVLVLAISTSVPVRFTVGRDDGKPLLDDDRWLGAGRPAVTEIPWAEKRPPSCLVVDWIDGDKRKLSSLWPVNVTDASKLPPPPELMNLSLEVLIEILSSARPLHEMLRRLGRVAASSTIAPPPITDPHKKVDTSGYLLRRVKRISNAVEGLRVRLERPAHQVEALRWRLRGPVGPLALARQLLAEEPDAASFLLAEIALMMRNTDWSGSVRFLGREKVEAETGPVVTELRQMVGSRPAPVNLAKYVARVFREIAP